MRHASVIAALALAATVRAAPPPDSGRGPAAIGPAHLDGVAAYRQGDYQQAVSCFRRERSANPSNRRALAFMGFCYEALGQTDRARDCWARLVEADEEPRLADLARVRLDALPGAPAISLNLRPDDETLRVVESRPVEFQSEHFHVRTHNAALAGYTAKQAERSLERIRARLLGSSLYPHQVHIRIHRDVDEFRDRMGAPHWSGGGFRFRATADGTWLREIHLVQLNPDGTFNDRLFDVELPHELSHVVLAEFFGQRRCPIWLDEALAMMAERRDNPERAEIIGINIPFGHYVPLRDFLDRSDWPPDYPMTLLYAQAESVGRFLWDRLGDDRGRDWLAQVRSGSRVSDALARLLQRPIAPPGLWDDLESEWQQAVAIFP